MTEKNAITVDIQHQLIEIIHRELNVVVPAPDTDLLGSGLLDSLNFVELLVKIEGRFGTKIALEELEIEDFRSVEKISQFVSRSSERQVGL